MIEEKKQSLYPGFTLLQEKRIEELSLTYRYLRHEKSSAHIVHLENEDPENLFCLSFKTHPLTSNGVAHILEHTVLCGSKKYPVKDPFFAMQRRSLNTFMNALTGNDFTCYPASTQVEKDFYNLLDVYLDAVFEPNLNKLSFLQEGHRLDFEKKGDKTSPLKFKGIVYNEMKGAMSAPERRLHETLFSYLFSDLPYAINSGGSPEDIPNLSYEELIAFHKTYYHPSRCLFFFYGNLPLEKHLAFIEERTLKNVSPKPPIPPLLPQKRFLKPLSKVASYPLEEHESVEDKAYTAISFLTCSITNQEEALALDVLETALMGNDAAPLKRALLESGLLKNVSSYFESDMSELPLILVAKGCKKENHEKIVQLVDESLKEIVETGINPTLIESALHEMEIDLSEITHDQGPYGLTLFMRSALMLQHDVNPIDALCIHSLFEGLRKRWSANPQLFSDLIKKYLIDNPHRVNLLFVPDKTLSKKEQENERLRLQSMKESLSDTALDLILKQAKDLKDFQEMQEEQSLDVLPKLTLKDVPKEEKEYPLQEKKFSPWTLFTHETFTNKIIYTDVLFPIGAIEKEKWPLLSLFTTLFHQIGLKERSYLETLAFMQAHTGGIHATTNMFISALDPNRFEPCFQLRAKCLDRKQEKLFPFLSEMVSTVSFHDKKRLKELLTKHFLALEQSLNYKAIRYALALSAESLDNPSFFSSQLGSLPYLHYIRNIMKDLDQNIDRLILDLEKIKDLVLNNQGAHLIITADQKALDTLERERCFGLLDLPLKEAPLFAMQDVQGKPENLGKVISSSVSFSGYVLKTPPYQSDASAALSVAADLMNRLVLHPKIREQGGAYGGGASHNDLAAHFSFYAYRDPNIAETLNAFQEAIDRLAHGTIKQDVLDEAKLESIQSLDAPVSPGSRGYASYAYLREGRGKELRDHFRQKLLNLTPSDINEAVAKHLSHQRGSFVSFASKELLEQENDELKSPMKIEVI